MSEADEVKAELNRIEDQIDAIVLSHKGIGEYLSDIQGSLMALEIQHSNNPGIIAATETFKTGNEVQLHNIFTLRQFLWKYRSNL